MLNLNLESPESLARILKALETQACRHETDNEWAEAENDRALAADLEAQAEKAGFGQEYRVSTPDGELLWSGTAVSFRSAYDSFVAENCSNGTCEFSVEVEEVATETIVEF